MKFVREQSRPISGDTGLKEIQAIADANKYSTPAQPGKRFDLDTGEKYIAHLLSYLDRSKLKKLKIVVNAGNGGAGMVVDKLEPHFSRRRAGRTSAPARRVPRRAPPRRPA
jgi:phosphomannomutase